MIFHTGNVGSVSQKAAKLLAVKVEVLKEKCAISAIAAKVCASACGLGSSLSGLESQSMTNVHEADSNLRMGFAKVSVLLSQSGVPSFS